jgi:hypothetical protein
VGAELEHPSLREGPPHSQPRLDRGLHDRGGVQPQPQPRHEAERALLEVTRAIQRELQPRQRVVHRVAAGEHRRLLGHADAQRTRIVHRQRHALGAELVAQIEAQPLAAAQGAVQAARQRERLEVLGAQRGQGALPPVMDEGADQAALPEPL